MEVSGQLLSPAALTSEKEPPRTHCREAGCTPEPVWTRWQGKKSLPRPYRELNPVVKAVA
jgi:hypothetical protein